MIDGPRKSEEVKGIVMDITDRKKNEDSVRGGEDKFRTLAEAAQDAIIMIDAQGTITFWNGSAARIFGSSAEEALGRNLDEWLASPRYGEKDQKEFGYFGAADTASPPTGRMLQMDAL